MTVYLLDEPFETKVGTGEETVTVTAYDDGTNHFWFGKPGGWQAGVAVRGSFDPPPPIPAAARKPKVGEVWVFNIGGVEPGARLVIKDRGDTVCAVSGNGHFKVWSVRDIIRPATPEEAEPFRELMNGLMLALGEGPAIDPSKDITGKNLRDMMRDPRYWPDRDPNFINKVVGSFAELYPDNGND